MFVCSILFSHVRVKSNLNNFFLNFNLNLKAISKINYLNSIERFSIFLQNKLFLCIFCKSINCIPYVLNIFNREKLFTSENASVRSRYYANGKRAFEK